MIKISFKKQLLFLFYYNYSFFRSGFQIDGPSGAVKKNFAIKNVPLEGEAMEEGVGEDPRQAEGRSRAMVCSRVLRLVPRQLLLPRLWEDQLSMEDLIQCTRQYHSQLEQCQILTGTHYQQHSVDGQRLMPIMKIVY